MKIKNVILLLLISFVSCYAMENDSKNDSDDEDGETETQLVYQTTPSPTHKHSAKKSSSAASGSVKFIPQPVQVINPKMSGIFVTDGAELISNRMHVSYDNEDAHGTAPKKAMAALGADSTTFKPSDASAALSSAELHHLQVETIIIQRAHKLPFSDQVRISYATARAALVLEDTRQEVIDTATQKTSQRYKTKKLKDKELKDFLHLYKLVSAVHYTNRKAIAQIEVAAQKDKETEANRIQQVRNQFANSIPIPSSQNTQPKNKKTDLDARPKGCMPECMPS